MQLTLLETRLARRKEAKRDESMGWRTCIRRRSRVCTPCQSRRRRAVYIGSPLSTAFRRGASRVCPQRPMRGPASAARGHEELPRLLCVVLGILLRWFGGGCMMNSAGCWELARSRRATGRRQTLCMAHLHRRSPNGNPLGDEVYYEQHAKRPPGRRLHEWIRPCCF